VTIEQSFPHAGRASPERWRTLVPRQLLRVYLWGERPRKSDLTQLGSGSAELSRRCIARASHHLLIHRTVPWALGSGAWEPSLMKRKMGVFARNLFYWFWILRIRRLHASAEGELITVKLSSSFKKLKPKLNAQC